MTVYFKGDKGMLTLFARTHLPYLALALLLSSYHFANIGLSSFSVIEVASGEYGENVIPSLVKAWKAREETMTQKKSLTSSTSCSYDSRNMVVSMLPNCNVKTSTDSIIQAASQTTQVNAFTHCHHRGTLTKKFTLPALNVCRHFEFLYDTRALLIRLRCKVRDLRIRKRSGTQKILRKSITTRRAIGCYENCRIFPVVIIFGSNPCTRRPSI